MIYLGINEPVISEEIGLQLKKKHNIHNEFIVGIIGRIEAAKGQYILIEAISILKDLDIKALIVGHAMDEPYRNELQKKIRELGIEDKVIFTGFTKNVNEYLSLCDVSVLITKKETFGLVVIESMVNKTPVIATANGGPLEIIDDNINGLLVDRDTEHLAQKIKLLYDNETFKNDLGLNGYIKVKDSFSKDKQMKKMHKVINES